MTAGQRLLFQLRTCEEGLQRDSQFLPLVRDLPPLVLPISRPSSLSNRQRGSDMVSCYNKTTAFYVIDPFESDTRMRTLPIDTWLFRKWFRPYKTDISYGNYFAKILPVTTEQRSMDIDTKDLIDLHFNVCEQSQRYVESTFMLHQDRYQSQHFPLHGSAWSLYDGKNDERIDGDFFLRSAVLKPLFRALFVVVIDYRRATEIKSLEDVGDLKVRIVLTGVTDGLSAPIDFDSISSSDPEYFPGLNEISTTMNIAYNFISFLEHRESMAHGSLQNHLELTDDDRVRYAEILLKKVATDGQYPPATALSDREVASAILRPSHTWVDTDKVPFWCGKGAEATLQYTELGIRSILTNRD
ncbi:hypothetical protein KJ359_001870 [Pestalotiopsis sp. 9143b]|nr:hypothetical protein KJ359_001870 [Pestalotiopsis sp. 9143b]